MPGAAHLAKEFFVLGALFQLQPFLIEGLQQFRGGLKKQLAELAGASIVVRPLMVMAGKPSVL